jgi:hypothetical protein|tara:strand:+ start:10557 stop:10826 length:270 start_codon:yes stop_codon:yes gene_type:complete
MFKIFDEHYYIDLDSIEECTKIKSNDELSGDTENQIHVVKYETIKFLMEIIMTENEAIDEKLGMHSNQITIPFKIAFNTLLFKKIINKL